jgi:lipoprotein-releasing system ATP-binding protein
MSDHPILSFNGLEKTYHHAIRNISVTVFKDLSLSLNAPEILAVMGESGAGKSTLLNLIGMLDTPTQGKILYQGQDYSNVSDKPAFRGNNIGFIFQNHMLLDDFSALENVMIPYLIRSTDFQQAREKAKFWLNEVGMSHRAGHKPGEMSGGENQRTAIARALINDPPMILADEPTGNLDFANQEKINDLFIRINEKFKKLVFIATHNEAFALKCHSVYRFQEGQLVKTK